MMKKIAPILLLPIFFICIGCTGLLDFNIKLADQYELRRGSAYDIAVCLVNERGVGTFIVDTYVEKVHFDSEYIFAQQQAADEDQYPPINDESPRSYYAIVVASGEVIGPMTETEFETWYATLGRQGPPNWISTLDQPALSDRSEELYPEQTRE